MFSFFKQNKKDKWNNVPFEVSPGPLNDKMISSTIDRFWKEYINNKFSLENDYLLFMFRVELTDGDIKTITKLTKLRISSKEMLKSFISLKSFIMKELYNNLVIKRIIISYGKREFKRLKYPFEDQVEKEYRDGLIVNKFNTHLHKKLKLPITTNYENYGKVVANLNNFKSILLNSFSILNIFIEEREGFIFYKCDYILRGKTRASWEDKIISFETDSLIRIINNTVIDFQNGEIISIRTVIKKGENIKPIKPHKKFLSNIVSADLETYLKDNEMVVYLASFAKDIKSNFFFNKNPRILFESLFSSLFSSENRFHQIYFHNLSGFDGFFLIKQLLNLGYIIDPLIHNGKLIQLKVKKKKNRNDTFVIKDSFLLLLSSLENLAKYFKLENKKGIFPYLLKDIDYIGPYPDYKFFNKNKVSLKEYLLEKGKYQNILWDFRKESINYCVNDSKLLLGVMNKFARLIFDRFKLNLRNYPTLPSLAFAIFRAHYLPKGDLGLIDLKGKISADIRLSYTGGSTDMFIPKNPKGKKIYAYDVNSLYPFVMKNYMYPIGKGIFIEFIKKMELSQNSDIFGFFLAEIIAPINLSHPILQIHHKTKSGIRTISPVGSFSAWFFTEELKNALNFGYKINLIKGYTFEKVNIFSGYVNDLYSLRLSYPKSDPMNFISKILLNSLYGRFGMKEINEDIFIIKKGELDNFILRDNVKEIIDFGKQLLIKVDLENLEDKIDGKENIQNINISIASSVTAYARIFMSQFKNNPLLPNLYYSDTDSVYFDGPLPDNFISSTRLGALKLEGIYNEAIFLAPKVYALKNQEEEIIKIKGLNKQAINENNINLDSLNSLLLFGHNITPSQIKWRKDLSSGTIKLLEQIYTLRVTDNKRDLIYSKEGKLIGTKSILI